MKQIYTLSSLKILVLVLFTSWYSTSFSQSVLAEGQWYKIGIEKDGVYKLSYQDFTDMGFDVSTINPDFIQIFSNLEGVLPEPNEIAVSDSLTENAIWIEDGDDGSFDENDYVVFYAKTADTWDYDKNTQLFSYTHHPYADLNYYYITVGNNEGLRIHTEISSSAEPIKTITDFLDYQVHDENLINFVKSGREWYGESFDENGTLNIVFDFPNFNNKKSVKANIYGAHNATVSAKLFIEPLGASTVELDLPRLQGSYTMATIDDELFTYQTEENEVSFNISYSKPSASADAWLDYLEVSAYRNLVMHNHQLAFSYFGFQSISKVYQFKISNANINTKVWDITVPFAPKEFSYTQLVDDSLIFKHDLTGDKYYTAFEPEGLFSPLFVGEVANQNLKGLPPFDMVIVTIEEFKEQAQRLADFHIEKDNLHTIVLTTDEIYNEFSSGKQDPTAIRNFMRYHYLKNNREDKPEYLLLFGDASYDYRDVLPENTNIVPVYQSKGSISLTNTYNTDDYYGIMAESDGDSALGDIQISIGRFPVNNLADAKIMVDKTIHYASNQTHQMGDWRNKVCFIADDQDNNLHFDDSNELADDFLVSHPEFNVDKLFLDSYVRQSTTNGFRYPDVTEAINRSVEEGVLFFNYTGHGGHIALTDERILQIPDIISWKNYDKLGVWIVASCEFGPFDDPSHISAGEHVVLNRFGGGVALFTTTRLAYASYNFRLNQKFHEIAFSRKSDGSHYRMGEIIKYAKNESGNKERNLNFVLLGDPALKMAYPEFNVETTHINGLSVDENSLDTLKARQTINVEGEVTNTNHDIDSGFNGTVDIKVYGKASTYSTLANDSESYKASFEVIDLLIYKGQSLAKDGKFEFSFVVPTDIPTSFGNGKISYYATEEIGDDLCYDANGGFIDFIVGGVDNSIENDLQGPEINVHLDTYEFQSGDPTNTDPLMLINLYDDNGINNIELGFGKEIKASVDTQDNHYLNDYYQPTNNSHKEGKIEYNLNDLDYGSHELTVKAWDMFDNSSSKSISFIVIAPLSMTISNVTNNPNPFIDYTSFVFDHNQTNETELLVKINIYDISGKRIWTYEQEVTVLGNSIEPITITAGDQAISNLKTGVYSYILEASNSKDEKVYEKQKMVLVK